MTAAQISVVFAKGDRYWHQQLRLSFSLLSEFFSITGRFSLFKALFQALFRQNSGLQIKSIFSTSLS